MIIEAEILEKGHPRCLLDAMSAQDVEAGEFGLWQIRKLSVVGPDPLVVDGWGPDKKEICLPPGVYTSLFRHTDATIHQSIGELVMHDFPEELRQHLEFAMRARGHVLITGLGLGCVARGCLANPNVRHVTIIEKCPGLLSWVGQTFDELHDTRVTLIEDDAFSWVKENKWAFTCAWHDLWVENNKGSKHLQQLHLELMIRLRDRVEFQGAWKFPREFRRRGGINFKCI